MSSIEAWPFIVARNATLDWRPILAPPFLVDAQADYLLVTETSGPGGDTAQLSLSVVESSTAGTITLVFRSTPATSDLLGSTPAEPLLDRFGRPLHVVEGLVLRGDHRTPPGELRPAVDRVRNQTLRLLPAFWEEESEAAATLRSEPMMIDTATEATSGRRQEGDRGPENGNLPAVPFALIVVIALSAAAWWWWTHWL